MATHTKIIDLFGIPACGKSTLSKYIKDNYADSITIADELDIVNDMKRQAHRLIKISTLGVIIRNLRIRIAAPLDKKRRVISLRYWIISGLLYHFIKECTNYDLVLFDHGDIQRFVSLERGENLHLQNRFGKACSRYIDSSEATIYVYCKINEETALERMKKRGRNKGRIDILNDEELQLTELKAETKRFDYYASLLGTKGKNLIALNMEQTPPKLAEQLMAFIYN